MMKNSVKIILVGLVFGLMACQSQPTAPTNTNEQFHQLKAKLIHKDGNLYHLDDLFYRSQQLDATDYPLLKAHNIKTIINLRFFDRNDDKQAFGQTDIQLINTPLLTWAITPKDVAEVLWEVEKAQKNGAVLVHCYHGADRTGLISAMYRVIYQKHSLQVAKNEMMFGNFGYHSMWKNLENFFTEQNLAEIKTELAQLRQQNK